jgi:hypothetical protein
MTKRRSAHAIVLTCLLAAAGAAQETVRPGDPAGQPPEMLPRHNTAGILFDRNLNTLNWIARSAIDTSVAGCGFSFRGLYGSNTIILDPTGSTPRRTLQSTQHNLALLTSVPIVPLIHAQTQWTSLQFSDTKDVGLSNVSSRSALAGIEYTPFPFLSITPMAGYRWDNQANVVDRGPSYTAAAAAHDLDIDGYRMSAATQYHQDVLDPRLLASHVTRAGVQKSFSPVTRDSLDVGVYQTRREFYALADSSIESRIENVFSFTNLLDYEVASTVLTSFSVTVSSRGLDKNLRWRGAAPVVTSRFDTRIDEFRLDTYIQALYRSDDGASLASLRFAHSERDETHAAKPVADAPANVAVLFADQNRQEHMKDNTTRRSTLSGSLAFPVSTSDRFAVATAASILRYDTPSMLNVEDRDELLVTLAVGSTHRLSPVLDLAVALDASLKHLVYLLRERSANNTINRVLRLAPRVTYRPTGNVTSINAFEVLANYTVYDFENELAQVKSFSYRQFGWMDSTSVALTRRLGVDGYVYVKLYERGQLSWNAFTERTQNSFIDQTLALQVWCMPMRGLFCAAGIRSFSQRRYVHGVKGRTLESHLLSVGPTCTIRWEAGPHSSIGLQGWYERRSQTDAATKGRATMTMDILLTL